MEAGKAMDIIIDQLKTISEKIQDLPMLAARMEALGSGLDRIEHLVTKNVERLENKDNELDDRLTQLQISVQRNEAGLTIHANDIDNLNKKSKIIEKFQQDWMPWLETSKWLVILIVGVSITAIVRWALIRLGIVVP
ncbi:hypothetical protein GF380_00370 [Candidatus Uhrbacteria bacterium]|nr:hypothetical protein [Candidatus Uhrbacteria bacterium]